MAPVKAHATLSKNHALNRAAPGATTTTTMKKKKKKKTMSKKKDKKKKKVLDDEDDEEEEDNSESTPSATDTGIDELFASARSKKDEENVRIRQAEEDEEDEDEEDETDHIDRHSHERVGYGVIKSPNMPSIINPEAPVERIDPESGFPVYKAHLLKVGEGGGTPLCPFDCNCCF